MANTKKRKIMFIVFGALVIAMLIALLIFLLGNKNFGLKMSGSYLDNVSDFATDADCERLTGLSRAYLERITYNITGIDKDRMIATLVVKVPDITELLPTIVDQTIETSKDVEYEELLTTAKTSLEEAFKSESLIVKEDTINLSIEERDGSYKLVPNEEWNKLILGNIENMYLDYLKILIGEMTNEVPKYSHRFFYLHLYSYGVFSCCRICSGRNK